MKKIIVYTVDAFTDKLFKGNPAGVVINGDILHEEEMQLIAKELNLSETAFLISANNNDVDYSIKYFTPSKEIDFCGHATLAMAWVLGKEYDTKHNELKLKTNIGVVKIKYNIENNEIKTVFMEQIEPKVKDYLEDEKEIFDLLNLSEEDLDSRYKIKYSYTGNWHLLIPIKSKKIIDNIQVNYPLLAKHNSERNISTTHLYTFDTSNDSLLYTRGFAPALGINEDPVTGSANGALAGYLALDGIIDLDKEYIIEQGNSMNRLGRINIKTITQDDKIKIQVGGKAVIVLKGEITLI